jgi:hypothetical protein
MLSDASGFDSCEIEWNAVEGNDRSSRGYPFEIASAVCGARLDGVEPERDLLSSLVIDRCRPWKVKRIDCRAEEAQEYDEQRRAKCHSVRSDHAAAEGERGKREAKPGELAKGDAER